MPPELAHIDVWIFDLDLTLYGPEHNIMEQVRNRIADYVGEYFSVDAEKAHEIRHNYWRKYGTTLGGMMAEHRIEPQTYLDFVHDVDLSLLKPCDILRSEIAALPGRKLIFTNADAPYGERVLKARGLENIFEGVFDIHRMDHKPKPDPLSYDRLCAEFNINPRTALFIEDSAHNLYPAKTLGMTTVWLDHQENRETDCEQPDFVDHVITDLAKWLVDLKEPQRA